MKIGIDACALSTWRAGTTRAVENVVRELVRIDEHNEYFLYSNHDFALPVENGRWQKRVDSRFGFLPGAIWIQTRGKKMILGDRVNAFWATAHVLPLGLPPAIRKVLLVHDVVWVRYPETMATYTRMVHRLLAGRSVREAETIIAVSESTKRDLVALLDVPAHKVKTIHHGVSSLFRPHDVVVARKYIAAKYGVSETYICAVGTVEPRKNLSMLVEAVGILRKRAYFPFQLVIAGGKGWKNSAVHRSVLRAALSEDNVKFLGFVPEEDLPLLYSGASVFVFPSIYEGFGLPLVEAMACGAPIVASNVSSIPEVVLDAGLLVPPHDPEAFAQAILRVLNDCDLRSSLITKGIERARHFRWDKAAREVLQVFNQLASPQKM